MSGASEILIGRIVKTSGIKGYVKIHMFTDNPTDVNDFPKLFDDNKREYKVERIISAKGSTVTLKLSGIESINEAQKLVGTDLFIDRSDLEELDDNSYYYSDLIGLDIYFEDETKYGTIVDIVNYGASDIVEIKEIGTGKLVMYPFTEEFIKKVDFNEKKIVLRRVEII